MSRRRRDRAEGQTEDMQGAVQVHPKPRRSQPLEPKTDNQLHYIQTIQANTLTFGLGPAGTGKTFIATCMAIDALQKGLTEKIILTRPAQEAGEKLGFLPGELHEKYEPYLRPFLDILMRRAGQGYVECAVKNGRIEPLPLGFMRGMTFDDCWVLFDEGQNCTPVQMKMFLTRIGERCKVIVNGDVSQQDIPGPSGLYDGYARTLDLPGVGTTHFTKADVVRSGLVCDIVGRYERKPSIGATDYPLLAA